MVNLKVSVICMVWMIWLCDIMDTWVGILLEWMVFMDGLVYVRGILYD